MRYRFLRYPGGKAKAMTLSYDDGCRDDLRFSDIISQYGLKCTFNLNSLELKSNNLSDEEIRTYFIERGHEIAVHGAFHRAAGAMRPIEGIRETLDCRLELENRFDTIIRGMAYPDTGITIFHNDASYEKVKGYLSELDIAYARTLGEDNNSFQLPNDWHAWMPTVHHRNPKLMQYVEEFINLDLSANISHSQRAPRLFYMWGHSYEFERDNNWEIIYDFCEKVSYNDDIWYATNIEFYDYVKAYNSLIYSADGRKIYNPTLFEIWFDIDGVMYKINPGETINIHN